MKCSYPQIIPRPGLTNRPMLRVPGSDKPYAKDYLIVPCGKCMNCMKSRQQSFAARIRAEAEAKGSMCFITLTYNNDNLPLVSTLWHVDKQSGEMSRLTDPDFVCYSRREDFFGYRGDVACQVQQSSLPRYIDRPFLETEEFDIICRITPSVCRADVQTWIKRVRMKFKREQLSEFTYAVCSEYGPRTCRPHYHVCLFGLSENEAFLAADMWHYGFTKVDYVQRVNFDGSDGFSKVANYLGKYVSKGVFECDSVKCGAAVGCRMMTSIGLGNSIIDKFASYVRCEDMVGKYNLDTFFSEEKQRLLSRTELGQLCAEIPKRLSISFDGKYYFALPRVFRNKIFYVKKVSEKGNTTYYRPSRLWKMVTDSIQRQYVELREQEFKQFCSSYDKGKVVEAVAQFNFLEESTKDFRESLAVSDYKSKLSSSKL